MKYRKFGKLDWQASVLGFGAMRLPYIGSEAVVNEEMAIKMMRYAIDHGVNYIDSAWVYHSQNSEAVVGKALQNGYRTKVKIATKLPTFIVNSPNDFDRMLDTQLRRFQTDKIDFYLLHNLNKTYWPKMKAMDYFKWAEKQLAAGRIGHLGFSFHDDYKLFKEIVDGYDNWTMCQIQYNYMDEHFQAGTAGLKYAAGKGLAVVVMEPVRGGHLSDPPQKVKQIWDSAPVKREPAEWALRWVWDHPEVTLALSGMSNMQQVTDNVKYADDGIANSLKPEDYAIIGKVRDFYRSMTPVECTGCGYCLPCKNGVEIPRVFQLYNDAVMYDSPEDSRITYTGQRGFKREQRAEHCQECNDCKEKCPQGLEIPALLKEAHAYLDKPAK